MIMKVEYTHPDFPKGHEFDIGGLCFPNGESVEVSAEQAAEFALKNGTTLQNAAKVSDFLSVSGSSKSEGGDS
jgi:hypothetical protein